MPQDYRPTDRRPIAARGWKLSQRLADALARAGVSPNAISLAGVAASALGGLAFASTAWSPSTATLAWLAGAACVQSRLLCNMFDGMVAIATGKASPLGELYNEVPDRVSDCLTFIGLGYAAGSDPTLGYLAAIAAVFVAYVRAMGKSAGLPQDYSGPLAKPQRIFVVTMTSLAMALLPAAWEPSWRGWGIPAGGLAIVLVGTLITAARRLGHVAAGLKG